MKRPTVSGELGFGSDSFLDIVANIVGILIILIVVAGLRVSNTPVPSTLIKALANDNPIQTTPHDSTAATPVLPADEDAANTADDTADDTVPELAVSEPPEPAPQEEPPTADPKQLADLEREAESLRGEIRKLDERAMAELSHLKELTDREILLDREIAAASEALAMTSDALAAASEDADGSVASLKQTEAQLHGARQELRQAEREQPAATKVPHRLTPVSQVVTGNELHLRLSGEHVSVVPLDELTERLKAQIERQKDWLLRFRRHRGTVGPVRGYTLEYLVERQAMSLVDELRQGRGLVRIAVSKFEIQTQPGLKTESVQDALQSSSAFHAALLRAEPDTTLTFWVYPDSFGAYRQLQHYAQREGFSVAARPLPFGVPIAGSPSGSRSAGQ